MSKFATLKDLSGSDDKSKKDPAKKGKEDYVGGGASGLNVLNPGRPDDEPMDARSHMARILEKASEAGAAPLDETLGKPIQITFYKNGFTVEEGDLRKYDDPANAAFLAAIDNGTIPHELTSLLAGRGRRKDGDIEAGITINNKKEEEFVPPAYRAFSGAGAALGSSGGGKAAKGAVVSTQGRAAVVDDSKPIATLQVKLLDGRREKVVLNLSHTVGDLQLHVAALKGTAKPFLLTAGFPPKPLEDGSLTLEAAGLKSAMITQKEA